MSIVPRDASGSKVARLDPLGMEPGRLWSLWDMLRVKSGPFVRALTDIAIMTATLDNIRQTSLQTTSKITFGYETVLMLHRTVMSLMAQLSELNAIVTKTSAERLEIILSRVLLDSPDGTMDYEQILNVTAQSRDIVGRIGDDLATQLVLAILPGQAAFFDQGAGAFGHEIEAKHYFGRLGLACYPATLVRLGERDWRWRRKRGVPTWIDG